MYASLEHLRAEGITKHEAGDERATDALRAAMQTVDRVCGWFFEPRKQSFAVSGRGGPTVGCVKALTLGSLDLRVMNDARQTLSRTFKNARRC